jgi:hypothetical protein
VVPSCVLQTRADWWQGRRDRTRQDVSSSNPTTNTQREEMSCYARRRVKRGRLPPARRSLLRIRYSTAVLRERRQGRLQLLLSRRQSRRELRVGRVDLRSASSNPSACWSPVTARLPPCCISLRLPPPIRLHNYMLRYSRFVSPSALFHLLPYTFTCSLHLAPSSPSTCATAHLNRTKPKQACPLQQHVSSSFAPAPHFPP